MPDDTTEIDRLRSWCRTLEEANSAWQDENARLRSCISDDAENAKLIMGENAKLRELVIDLYRCSDPCNDCQHYNGSNEGFYCNLGIGWKARRMRELGIKVIES